MLMLTHAISGIMIVACLFILEGVLDTTVAMVTFVVS